MEIFNRNKLILMECLDCQSVSEVSKSYGISLTTTARWARSVIRFVNDTKSENFSVDLVTLLSNNLATERLKKIVSQMSEESHQLRTYAREVLQKQYGEHFAAKAEQIANDWHQLKKNFHSTRKQKDLTSIKRWLIAEGWGSVLDKPDLSINYARKSRQAKKDWEMKEQPLAASGLDIAVRIDTYGQYDKGQSGRNLDSAKHSLVIKDDKQKEFAWQWRNKKNVSFDVAMMFKVADEG